MDGYRYLQPDNAVRSGRHCNGIMQHDALGQVMPDSREPVTTSSGFAIIPTWYAQQRSSDKSRRMRP